MIPLRQKHDIQIWVEICGIHIESLFICLVFFMSTTRVPDAWKVQLRVTKPLELEVQTVVNYHRDTEPHSGPL